jgi:hypothetical protein
MEPEKTNTTMLENPKIDVKTKLAALWAATMFLYVYGDILGLFQPGALEQILAGKVWLVDITQTWALSAMIMMTIPGLMIFLSLALPATANRWTNIVLGIVYIAISIGSVVGETWAYLIFGGVVEVVLLVLIVRYAWKWPKLQA